MPEIEKDAREYWATVTGPADGWGHYVHSKYGASHWFMLAMWKKHGRGEFDAALTATRPYKEVAA